LRQSRRALIFGSYSYELVVVRRGSGTRASGGDAMKVEQVMTRSVASCTVDDTLSTAAQLMWDRAVGSVVVLVDGGRLAGMVTDRDVAMSAHTQGRLLREIPVKVAMTSEPEACRPDESVRTVVMRMRQREVRRLPVVGDNGLVIGLVSLDALAREATRRWIGVSPKEIAVAFGITAKTSGAPQTHEAAGNGNGRLGARLDPTALANEVGDRARDAWERIRTTFNELGEERPNRNRAEQLASTLVRNVKRRARTVKRKTEEKTESRPPAH
jgi:CBS domain-containing protein